MSSCRQDGMCQGIYEEAWDKKRHRFICRRIAGTEEACSCPTEKIIHPCRNSFLCQRYEVPAAVLTNNQGCCKTCSASSLHSLIQNEPMPKPYSGWECPGCKLMKRKVCVHPACRWQHAFCMDCSRKMLLHNKDKAICFQCPLCMPLFDMGFFIH